MRSILKLQHQKKLGLMKSFPLSIHNVKIAAKLQSSSAEKGEGDVSCQICTIFLPHHLLEIDANT